MGGTIDDEMVRSWWKVYLPHSHAAAYAAMPETEVVAVADTNQEKLDAFSRRWSVSHRYTDYREMIEHERPDIVSVTTFGTTHAEISIFAAEHGAKGIFCEKAMACSMEEADAMRDACVRNRVAFNLNASRRYIPGFEVMRTIVHSGEIGPPMSVIHKVYGALLLHTASHGFDTILYLLGDPEVEYVQGRLDAFVHGNGTVSNPVYDPSTNRFQGTSLWDTDPCIDWAIIAFKNGVVAHVTRTARFYEFDVVCEKGSVTSCNDNREWDLRVLRDNALERVDFPSVAPSSATIRCVQDLIRSIESDTLGHLDVSHRGMEISMAVAQSHIEDGSRVSLPLANRSLYAGNH